MTSLVYTALATPFTEQGDIDWNHFEKLLNTQGKAGIHGVVIAGTTGEAPTLTVQEKLSLIRKACAILPKNCQIMVGTGSNNTNQTLELSRLALEAGANQLLVVTPPYNKPSIAGLIKHYEAISGLGAPICLYHVPSRTGQHLTIEQLKDLCQIENIKYVKEASNHLAYFSHALLACDATFLTGDDPLFLPSLAVGGSGVISVTSNIFPKSMLAIGEHFMKGEVHKAKEKFQILLPFIEVLFCETNPAPLKSALHAAHLGSNSLRLPMVPVTDQHHLKIKKLFADTIMRLEEEGHLQ